MFFARGDPAPPQALLSSHQPNIRQVLKCTCLESRWRHEPPSFQNCRISLSDNPCLGTFHLFVEISHPCGRAPPCEFFCLYFKEPFCSDAEKSLSECKQRLALQIERPNDCIPLLVCVGCVPLLLLRMRLEICSANKPTFGKVNPRPHLENAVEKKEPVTQKGQFCPSGGTMFVIRLHMAPFRNSEHKVKFAHQC